MKVQGRTLPEALHQDYRDAAPTPFGPVTIRYMANQLGKSESWVYQILRGELTPGLNDLVVWAQVTGRTGAVDWWLGRMGLKSFRYPNPAGGANLEISVALQKTSDWLHEMSEIYADGSVSSEEAKRNPELQAKLDHAYATLAELDAKFDRDCELARSGRARTLAETEDFATAKERRRAR